MSVIRPIDRNAQAAQRSRRNWQRTANGTGAILNLSTSPGNAIQLTQTGYGVFVDGTTITINGSGQITAPNAGGVTDTITYPNGQFLGDSASNLLTPADDYVFVYQNTITYPNPASLAVYETLADRGHLYYPNSGAPSPPSIFLDDSPTIY